MSKAMVPKCIEYRVLLLTILSFKETYSCCQPVDMDRQKSVYLFNILLGIRLLALR